MSITNHALLRYISRIMKIDIKKIEKELVGKFPDGAPDGVYAFDGLRVCVRHNTIVTVMPKNYIGGFSH